MVEHRKQRPLKPLLLRLSLVTVEITSTPLLILVVLYLLTGYEMLVPRYVLLPKARAIHTDSILRWIFVVLVLLHSYCGLILLCERRIRNNLARMIIELLITGIVVFLVGLIIGYELMIR